MEQQWIFLAAAVIIGGIIITGQISNQTTGLAPPGITQEQPKITDFNRNIAIESFAYPGVGTLEMDEVDFANKYGRWVYAETDEFVSLNFIQKFDPQKIPEVENYTITSKDDPDYSSAQNPVQAGYRWRVIYAPLPNKDLKIAYRIFLKLPNKMKNKKNYTITAKNLGIDPAEFSFTFDDSTLNQNIKVNQVGYLPDAKKIAFTGQYMGTMGAMPIDGKKFEIIEFSSGKIFYTGDINFAKQNDPHSGMNVYEMDFSNVKDPGTYAIHVPGVGTSFPFRISENIYNQVSVIAMKGAYHARSGTELKEPYTRFVHGPAHFMDAFVLEDDPYPQWTRGVFDYHGKLYPTNLDGQKLDVSRGHYDAGDYGKYTNNMGFFVGYILAGYEIFPEKLMSDDLQVPESGDGIPDLLQEVKWELDALENMQDPNDGGAFCIVKPFGGSYEDRAADDPRNLYRVIHPKDTICTGAYAASLAKAARSPLMQKYYLQDAKRYLEKAQKAWNFLEKHDDYLAYFHYGADEDAPDKDQDERSWAAIELFGATGEKKYLDYFLQNHKPEYRRWGWVTLPNHYGQATIACATIKREFDPAMKKRCLDEIKAAADTHVYSSDTQSFHHSIPNYVLDFPSDFGWEFPQFRIYQLLIANGLSPNKDYERTALDNWNFVLGSNPLGYSYITGIGQKRFRSLVHTQSTYDNEVAPVSGLPISPSNWLYYTELYKTEIKDYYPEGTNYPKLMGNYDGLNVYSEFTVQELAEDLIGSIYFSKNLPNKYPKINMIRTDPEFGQAPLAVKFSPNVSDDGSIVSYFWDFDDGSFSYLENPEHIFENDGRAYEVVLTVTDNTGFEAYKKITVGTLSKDLGFISRPRPDGGIALYHFDNSLKDEMGNAPAALENSIEFESPTPLFGHTVYTSPQFSSENLFWMQNPNGAALKFGSVNDAVQITIPRKALGKEGELTFEAKIYVEEYDAYSKGNAKIFAIEQNERIGIGLYEDKWIGRFFSIAQDYTQIDRPFESAKIEQLFPVKKWHELKYVAGRDRAKIFVDGELAYESNLSADFFSQESDLIIHLGGIRGYIDEVRVF